MKLSILFTMVLLCSVTFVRAQTSTTPNRTFGDEVTTTIEKHLEIKPLDFQLNGSCNPVRYIIDFNLKELVPDAKKFDGFINNINFSYNNRLQGLQHQLTIPQNTSVDEVAINHLAKAKNLTDFVRRLTGNELYELSEKDQALLLDYFINHPIKKKPSVSVNGKKIIKAKRLPCFASSSSELRLAQWKKYPNLKWDLITTITIVCDCDQQTVGDLSQGKVNYKSEIQSVRVNNKLQFQKAKLGGPFHAGADCCGMEEEEEPEDDDRPTGPTQEYIPPQQTLGGSAGIGFSQDFDETNYCVGLEYLYQITTFGNNPFYVGAHATYGGTSFNEFNASLAQLGLSVQLFSPISALAEHVHITNGIVASYLLGSQTSNGLKDDTNGYSVTLHTGLNIPINENVSISLYIPVVSYQNVTFTNTDSGEFSVSETTLLINKNNPLRLGLRFRL